MKEYPDARQYYAEHVPPLVEHYIDSLHDLGIVASPTLKMALLQRAQDKTIAEYEEVLAAVLLHNLACIDAAYEPQRRKILRQQLVASPLLFFALASLAVYSFMQPGWQGLVGGGVAVVVSSAPLLLFLLALREWRS